MQVLVDNLGNLNRRVRVTVPDERVSQRIQERMQKLQKEAHLKGFRPGKVPARVLEQRFGASVRSEVISDLIEHSFRSALEEQALLPVGTPTIEEVKAPIGCALEFSASFEIFPEINLKPFAEYEWEAPQVEITEDDLANTVEQLRKRYASFEPVERAAALGDRITIDITTTVEGGAPEKQEDAYLVLEEENSLAGLVESFLGKQAGDEVSVELVYPADWANQEVASKPLKVEAVIKEVAEQILPDDTGLCVQLELGENEVENLHSRIRKQMEEELEFSIFEISKEALLEKLLADYDIDLPSALISQETNAVKEELKAQAKTLEEEAITEMVQRRVLLGLVVNEIIKARNLKASPERMHEHVRKLAMRFPDPQMVMRVYYNNKDLLAQVERAVLLDEAVREIVKEAQMLPKQMSYKEVIEGPQNMQNKE